MGLGCGPPVCSAMEMKSFQQEVVCDRCVGWVAMSRCTFIAVISISVTYCLSLNQWPLVECPSLLSSVKMIRQCESSRPSDNAILLAERRLPTLTCTLGPRLRACSLGLNHLTCHPHPHLPILIPLTPPLAFPHILPFPPTHPQSTPPPHLTSTPSATPCLQGGTTTTTLHHPRAHLTMIPLINPPFPQPFDILATTTTQKLSRRPQYTTPHSPVSPPLPPPRHFRRPS